MVSLDAVMTSPLAALIVAPEPLIVSVEVADSVTVLPEAALTVLPVPVSVTAAWKVDRIVRDGEAIAVGGIDRVAAAGDGMRKQSQRSAYW